MKRRYKLTRSLASAATLLSAGGMAGWQLAMAPVAGAVTLSTTTSTWTGGGTPANDTTGTIGDGSDWTDAANWSTASPDTAPTNGSAISTLTFPDLASCDAEFKSTGANSTSCYSSNNDLTGVSVGTIDIQNPPAGTYTDPSNNVIYSPGYNIGGNAITLTGGLTVTGSDMDHSPGMFSIPLTLGSVSQTWSLPGSQTDVAQNVTGASTDLTVQASSVGTSPNTGSTSLEFDGKVQTKSFKFSGQDTSQTGTNSMANGTLNLFGADLNGSNGNPVTVTDATMSGAGTVGALTVTGGYMNLQDVNTYGPVVLTATQGTLDSTSAINFDVNGTATTTVAAGTDYSQLSAPNGTVDLGGAALTLADPNMSGSWATCTEPVPGTVFTLVTAKSLTGTVSFDDNGSTAPVAQGGIVSTSSCDGSTTDQFRIGYNTTATPATVTATALDSTSTSLNVASNTPQVNQPDLVTATVSSTSGKTPTGTVSFIAQGATTDTTPTTVCSDVPLDANGKATCSVSFPNSGEHGIFAPYTSTGNFGSSNGGTANPIEVQPIPGAASSNSSTASGSTTTATATNPDNGVSATASGGNGTVTTSNYTSDPVAAPTFQSDGTYFDVQLSGSPTFTSMTINVPNVPAGGTVYWYNPSSGWTKVVGDTGSTQSPFSAVIDSHSSPTITQLGGTVFAVAGTGPAPGAGYDLAASDGGVFSFGDAATHFYGSMGGKHLNAPVVGMASTPSHKGYWLVASDGGVFSFGDAATHFYGSMGGKHLNAPVVGIASTPSGNGYWLVAADGGVFSFGDAATHFYGSMGGKHLNAPVVGIASTPDGNGYWLVASDGGVFSFGDAATHFYGSMGGRHLNAPVVGIASSPSGNGYWLVASDGGVFNFGDAPFHGSAVPFHPVGRIVGIAAEGSDGYWLVASDGGVFSFGDATAHYYGSMGGKHLNAPVVGMAGA